MVATLIRGYNPIWYEVDLTANAFDDTFYLFVLENTIPYIPETVWGDPYGTTVWPNPIRFQANGTLPNNIYFNPDKVYRLEFRQGNTQADPLIYLVENYVPGSGGGSSGNTVIPTDNQITNPQFSIINFESPYVQSSASTQDIDVAPGWVLSLEGSGAVTLERVPLNADAATANPTNAPYALRILLSGSWTSALLIQRFNQAGMLWADESVSSAITCRIESGSPSISAQLVNSMGTTLGTVLPSTQITAVFTEYTGHAVLGDPSNTDTPPDAWIEYQLVLPTSISPLDIYVTSFQIVASDAADQIEFEYNQDTIERQQDYTFHYYRDSILFQPKESILTGWDFGQNPWQFTSTSLGNVAANQYTADQTIIVQQKYVADASGNNVSVQQASYDENYGLNVTAVTSTNKFAMIQYIDPATMRPYWGNLLSSLVKLVAQRQNTDVDLRVKMKLIKNTSLPSNTGQNYPISAWTSDGEPTFAAGWSEVLAVNSPTYYLDDGENVLTFNSFDIEASTSATMTLAIVIYTLDNMIESGTADYITFKSASLVPNAFAIDCNPLSFDETLRRCQYYYESSYPLGVLPGASSTAGAKTAQMNTYTNAGSIFLINTGFETDFTLKRAVPTMTYYSTGGSSGNVTGNVQASGGALAQGTLAISAWAQSPSVRQNSLVINSTLTLGGTPSQTGAFGCAYLTYNFTANSRLGG